jgi:dihydrofolate reductase
MSGRRLILLISVSMNRFASRTNGTIDWLTPAPAVTTATSAIASRRGSSRDRRRIEMGKLIATTQATIDGVIDPVGEWVQPDGDHGDYSFERQARSGGLVLGRKTYEGLAGYWPSQTGKWADMVNAMPKYVGSNTLSGDLEWNATLLNGDLEDSIPELKGEVDGDLFLHGSGEFAYALAEKGLIDEFEVYLNPLVWGQGNVHVLGDRGTIRMHLDDVKRFDSGVVLLTYLPAAP